MYLEARTAGTAAAAAQQVRDQIARLGASGDAGAAVAALDKKIEAIGLAAAATRIAGVMNLLQSADVTPTTLQLKTIAAARAAGSTAMTKWTTVKTVDVPASNVTLRAAGRDTLAVK
jgi:hypothetical protein